MNVEVEIQDLKQMMADLLRSQIETDKQFKETDRKLDKRFNELYGMFSSQWGRLIESLVEGDLVGILQERGIEVEQTSRRLKGSHKGQNYEFDIIALNGSEVVVVEVKTTLKPKHVRRFVDKMDSFKTWVKRYAPHTVYGAVAFLQADAGAEQMAESKGLFVIRATGDSAAIVNKADFVPREF